jgi:hypothetical protein
MSVANIYIELEIINNKMKKTLFFKKLRFYDYLNDDYKLVTYNFVVSAHLHYVHHCNC